jgi:hypothetical protein
MTEKIDIVTFLGEAGNLRASVYFDEQYEKPFYVEFNICDEYDATLYYATEEEAVQAAQEFAL